MSTNVFVNGREICSKAAKGRSTAFPDVCFSPGPPPSGIPVPYPNTAVANDLARGAPTVLIKGKPACRKNHSYFATSTGDDPATPGLKKGVVSGRIKGKAYFISWSMNVKVEGMNATRHLDRMTHNHGSPANTPPTVYMDTADAKAACAKDRKKIKDECGPEDDPDQKDKKKKTRLSMKKLLGKKYKNHSKTLSKGGTDNQTWLKENCDFLWIKPGPKSHQDFLEKLDALKGDLDGAVEQALEQVKDKVQDEVWDAAKKKGGKLAARAGVKWGAGLAGAAVGGVGAVFTEGLATVWNIGDMLYTGASVFKDGYDIYQETAALKSQLTDIKSIASEMDRLGQQARSDPQKAVADFMSTAARVNGCARARRCGMVAYKDVESLKGNGCCPGQTGHHLIPKEMVGDGCPGYDHETAPTVCVEGTNNTHGSHGQVHAALKGVMTNHYRNGGNSGINYPTAKKMAMGSFYKTFPESGCSRKCLEAQLDGYYKNKCTKTMTAASGSAGGDDTSRKTRSR